MFVRPMALICVVSISFLWSVKCKILWNIYCLDACHCRIQDLITDLLQLFCFLYAEQKMNFSRKILWNKVLLCKKNNFTEQYYPASLFSDALGKLLLEYKGTTVFYGCSVKKPASHNRKLWVFCYSKEIEKNPKHIFIGMCLLFTSFTERF